MPEEFTMSNSPSSCIPLSDGWYLGPRNPEPTERQTVHVTALTIDSTDEEWNFPMKLSDLPVWFGKLMSLVPAAHQADAVIKLTGRGDYDYGHEVQLTLSYSRPETDAEMQRRLAYEEEAKDIRLAHQRKYDLADIKRLRNLYPEEFKDA